VQVTNLLLFIPEVNAREEGFYGKKCENPLPLQGFSLNYFFCPFLGILQA
jgi:hypothetical protein